MCHSREQKIIRNQLSRRAFLQNGVLILTAGSFAVSRSAAEEPTAPFRIGLVTDLHYADKPARGTRYYRETIQKLETAGEEFRKNQLSFLVELGDLIDSAPEVSTELGYLKRINHTFSAISTDRHYVLGNHCVETLTKAEFLGEVGQTASYYSFDRNGYHFIVLDACFRADGQPYGRKSSDWKDANIPQAQLEWLKADLQITQLPVIAFAHQRLDVSNHYGVKNAAGIREILEMSNRVLAVFQGHSHKNDLNVINGIPYCTLVAMIEGTGAENNAYSTLELAPDGTLQLHGFLQQESRRWPRNG